MKNIQAFPQISKSDFLEIDLEEDHQGMTLLDYFAGQTMIELSKALGFQSDYKDIARWSYKMANAMLKERERWIGEQGGTQEEES